MKGTKFASEIGAFFGETSSKKNIGVSEVFEKLARDFAENTGKQEDKSRAFSIDPRKSKDKKKKG